VSSTITRIALTFSLHCIDAIADVDDTDDLGKDIPTGTGKVAPAPVATGAGLGVRAFPRCGAIRPAALRPQGLGRRRSGDQLDEREAWPCEVGQGRLEHRQLGRQLVGGLIVTLLL
jgi:hypothetical protein